jgi:hypothetical protein
MPSSTTRRSPSDTAVAPFTSVAQYGTHKQPRTMYGRTAALHGCHGRMSVTSSASACAARL